MTPTDPVSWPHGARVAVMLGFDFDAETLWLSRDPALAHRPGTLSQGLYGAKVGVPRILETLADFELPATFFVPGRVAETHTARVEDILAAGHEVGHHGYLHEWIDPSQPEREEEAFVDGLEALKKTVGVTPRGFRSPAWETSRSMIGLLRKHGLSYDSSMMDQITPYRHYFDGEPGPVELPVHWSVDDAPFTMFSIQTPRTQVSNEHLWDLWTAEFEETRRWGGLFNLTMHPQFTGRPARIALLRRFLQWVRGFDDVWFARGAEIADAWTVLEAKAAGTEPHR
ncbi:polysaccharide deacetylase [Sulfitobacter sp.]|uniref:polysaccharide deacetylase family protein n=1 Tax=Sulfitobacter sp. TaxID=1903071 RepID=UPI003297BDE7